MTHEIGVVEVLHRSSWDCSLLASSHVFLERVVILFSLSWRLERYPSSVKDTRVFQVTSFVSTAMSAVEDCGKSTIPWDRVAILKDS